jgi:haloacid dehalogenase-like hydrolase
MKPLASLDALPSEEVVLRPSYDLMFCLSELAVSLAGAARRSEWLDAFLFAAGMNQIAEDYVHEDISFLGTIGDRLLARGGTAQVAAGRAARSALAVAEDVRSFRRAMRETLVWQRQLAMVVQELARVVCAAEESGDPRPALEAALETLLPRAAGLPTELRERTARLPACFQAFDLDIPDVVELTLKFVESNSDQTRPLLVAGVRTGGSYLAPLCAAALESHGYTDVRVLTLRPQHPLLAGERAAVRRVAQTHGLALVIDDPPESGRTVARAAADIARLGLPRESIVLLLPLFGDRLSLAEGLRPYPSVLLSADEWSINGKLTPDPVGRVVGHFLGWGREVVAVEPVQLPARRWRRSHGRALFRVDLRQRGAQQSMLVLVEGVGIGYFGEQTMAVADRLREHLPEIFGVEGGCLYRAWLSEEDRISRPGHAPDEELETAVARYVTDRRRALPVEEDRSVAEFGLSPVWEVASSILSGAFGRGAPAARLLLVDALVKRLLRVTRPSVVDGATSLSNWFSDGRNPGHVVKVEFATRSFWNLGLLSYDAVFDLAGAALSSPDDATAERLRSIYTEIAGESIDDERWLLYGLAQLWGRGRTRPGEIAELQREQARALRRYMTGLYLDDLVAPRDGPLWALDLDGVLETDTLGFPATTAAGAKSLRALICHGYRPVLVSGRSVAEVADRCRSYRLAGGVAEYGAAVYVAERDEGAVLLTDAQGALLSRTREVLAGRPGVHLDHAYKYSVRAFVLDRQGRRRRLDSADVQAVLEEIDDPWSLELLVGESQTDFTARGVDKGTGVRALAERLDPLQGDPLLSVAVGDTVADLPMLREAGLRFAPAHATPALSGQGVELLEAPYQAGLAVAVGRLIGHEPGCCPACRPPRLSVEADLLVALLSAGEAGRLELARRFVSLRRRARSLTITPPRPERAQPWSSDQ